jgi:hypothetical protein
MTRASTSNAPVLASEPATVLPAIAATMAYVVLAGLTLSPLLWARVPPLVDYPNHLARMWVLAQDGSIAPLADNYVVHWQLVPDLALDLVVPLLAHVMPIDVAGRVFIALTMLGLLAGSMLLHRALYGRVGLWPLCSLLFLYNTALYWGFLNCLFGIALYLLVFSAWIATRGRSPAIRLTLFSIAAALILVSHLFAFALYALSVACCEFDKIRRPKLTFAGARSWIIACLHFLPAIVLFGCSTRAPEMSFVEFGGPHDKVRALMAPATFSGEQPPLFDSILPGLAYLFLLFAIWRRALNLAPEMRLTVGVLALTALLMPNWLCGSWLADVRLPVAFPFIIIGATRFTASRRASLALTAAALAILGLRVWTVSETWRDYDRQVTEFRAATQRLPLGAAILVVETPPGDAARAVPGLPRALARRNDETYWHMAALAVIDRAAFIPYLFSDLTPIRPTARHAGRFVVQGVPISPDDLAMSTTREKMGARATKRDFLGELPYWTEWPRHFDYVVSIALAQQPQVAPDLLEPVADGSFFRLYRVRAP